MEAQHAVFLGFVAALSSWNTYVFNIPTHQAAQIPLVRTHMYGSRKRWRNVEKNIVQ